jgi:hypothetical protein
MKLDNGETEKETLVDERVKRPRLKEQCLWQQKKVYDSYGSIKIHFSKNSDSVKSIRSALDAINYSLMLQLWVQ